MQRYLLSAATFFVVGLGCVSAIPVRPLHVLSEPPRAPKAAPYVAFNLGGTAWVGKVSPASDRLFIFEPDGTVSYRSPASKGNPIRNRGSWRLEGNTLIFDHYITKGNTILEFRGVISDDNTIQGEATSRTFGKTTQIMRRAPLNR